MKIVNFIRSLNIEEVPKYGADEIRYRVQHDIYDQLSPKLVGEDIALNVSCKERIVPIHRIVTVGDQELYVAYSQEVKAFLKLPFDAMEETIATLNGLNSQLKDKVSRKIVEISKQCELIDRLKCDLMIAMEELHTLEDKALNVRGATFFNRLKYFVTGNAEHIFKEQGK